MDKTSIYWIPKVPDVIIFDAWIIPTDSLGKNKSVLPLSITTNVKKGAELRINFFLTLISAYKIVLYYNKY